MVWLQWVCYRCSGVYWHPRILDMANPRCSYCHNAPKLSLKALERA